ncbi:MAG TPA: CAP domain-containing protein [Thermodesulfovibrionales bacterium]|jgi:uncharacterized protein YkwD|nr:CAP domain-containing protein [Thermodesulfovibrionales bacterium]
MIPLLIILLLASQSFAEPAEPRVNTKELETRIHELINIERHHAGLRPLALDAMLTAIARGHSRDMAERDYFSHRSPEGEDFLSRYKKKGFVCSVRVGQHIYGGAENISQNNLFSSVTYMDTGAHYSWNSLEEIARSTVRGWLKSPGHRENILQPVFRSHGIGASIKDGKVYITENFC